MRIWGVVAIFLSAVAATAQPDADLAKAGKAAMERREFEKAVELFGKAVELRPSSADHHYWLGAATGRVAQAASLFRKPGLAKKAQAALEKAVALDPNHEDARFALVDYYTIAPSIMGGDFDKALAQAAEIKKRDSLQGHRAYARIYMRQKKTDLARKELVDAVREQPDSARAHAALGSFLLSEKNYAGSLQEFEAALKLDPAFMPLYLRLGQHAAQSGTNYARGEESIRRYLAYKPGEDEPGHAAAWYWLGQIQEKQRRLADARQSYRNAQKLAPDDTAIKEALQRVK